MMKIVALLVLIVLATPAFAQDFQEFLKMFTDLGCKETDYIMSDMHRYLKMCDQCLSFQNFVGRKTETQYKMWKFCELVFGCFPRSLKSG
uniref:U18-Nephitoxin-Nsp1bb_1 n=1 Tax=Nephila sp. SGP-2016 TaxID=1905176 RepID=A0A4Q8K6B0_9ARAC